MEIAPKNILVIRPDAIGDLVLTLPAIQALKQRFPQAKLTLLIREYTAPVVKNHPAIDQIIYDYDLKKHQFDLSVNFYNEWRDTFAAWRAGIPNRLGDSSRILTSWMNNLKVFRNWNDLNLHEVEQNLALLKPLGITVSPLKPTIPIDPTAVNRIRTLFSTLGLKENERLAGLHCGAATSQAWPPENFAAVARELTSHGYRLLILGGEKEKNNARMIAAANPAAVNLTGRLPLADLIALISRLNFFLGMDTGPTHLAAAFNVPLVMIFLNPIAKPARWGPWLTRHLTVCAKKKAQTIPIDEVLTAVKTVLAGGGVTDLEESRRLWLKHSL